MSSVFMRDSCQSEGEEADVLDLSGMSTANLSQIGRGKIDTANRNILQEVFYPTLTSFIVAN